MKQYRNPTNYQRGMNVYVPAMTGSAWFDDSGIGVVDFGTPNVANPTAILSAAAVAATYGLGNTAFNGSVNSAALGFTRADGQLTDCPWGRLLTAVASGAATQVIVVNGYDYLGQPLQKSVALNGAAAVNFGCAFKFINTVAIPTGGGVTVNMGFSLLGLPYRTVLANHEFFDGLRVAGGTIQAPVLTDPATAATADPRGLYTSTSTLDGVSQLRAQVMTNAWVNAAGNGGLHGIRQFGG